MPLLPAMAAILLVIASGAAAAAAWVAVLAWWKALLLLILLIWAGRLLKKWHKCRGGIFATIEGCIMAILVVTLLGKTTAERVARAVTFSNIHYDPELRKKRGKWKIRTPQRRHSFGDVAIDEFHTFVMGVFINLQRGGSLLEWPDAVVYGTMLLHWGLIKLARHVDKGYKSGDFVDNVNILLGAMDIEQKHFATHSGVVLMCFHLVMGDTIFKRLILRIIRPWCYWGYVGNIAPSLSEDLFVVLLAIAEELGADVEQFFEALDRAFPEGLEPGVNPASVDSLCRAVNPKNVAEVCRLAREIYDKCADRAQLVVEVYNNGEQQNLLGEVAVDLHAHIAKKPAWLAQVQAMEGCSVVAVLGATEQDPGAPPLPPSVFKFDGCQGDDFPSNFRSRDPDRVAAFLSRVPAALVCVTLAAADGDIDSLPETETPAEIYSLARSILKGDKPLVAGALTDVHVVPVTGRGKLVFRDVASWVREGRHGLEVPDSVRSLYDSATDGWQLGSVVALHAHVHESVQSRRDAFAEEIAETDALNSRAAVALDEARAVGKFPGCVAVLYEQPFDTLAKLRDPVEAARRTFGESYGKVLMAFSDEGVACIDARAGNNRVARQIDEQVGEMIERLRKEDQEAGAEVIFVLPPDQAFETDLRKYKHPRQLRDAAYQNLVFVADVVDVFAANPGLPLDSPLLNPFRAYVAPNDDQIAEWRARVGNGPWRPPTAVFNSEGNLRTTEGYALELQEKRRAELAAEAARQEAANQAGERDVHSKKGASSGAFAKKTNTDFDAVLKPNGTWDRAALESYLEKLHIQIRAKKANSSHTINWPGGSLRHVAPSLNPLIRAAGGEGYGLKKGLELLEHFAKELKKIKDACA